jgi:hypothetical protein
VSCEKRWIHTAAPDLKYQANDAVSVYTVHDMIVLAVSVMTTSASGDRLSTANLQATLSSPDARDLATALRRAVSVIDAEPSSWNDDGGDDHVA